MILFLALVMEECGTKVANSGKDVASESPGYFKVLFYAFGRISRNIL